MILINDELQADMYKKDIEPNLEEGNMLIDVYKRQGYQFVNLGKLTDFIKKGDTPNDAWEKAKGQYGRVEDAAKIIDPRKE